MARHDLPTALRVTRAHRGYSLREVARRAGVAPTYVMRLERGTYRWVKPDTLRKLARGYRVEWRDLMVLAGYGDPGMSERTTEPPAPG